MVFQYHFADCLFLILVYRFAQHSQPLFVFCESLFQFFRDLSDIFLSYLLFIGKYCLFHFFRRNNLFDFLKHFLRYGAACIFMFCFSCFRYDFSDKLYQRLIDFMSHVNRFQHLRFRHFICSCLNHNYFFTGRCDSQVQIPYFPLFLGWIHDKFPVNHSDLRHRARAVKRNIGNTSGDRRTDHCHQFRTAGRVYAHDHIV